MALRERSVQISILGIKETAWKGKWKPEHVFWAGVCSYRKEGAYAGTKRNKEREIITLLAVCDGQAEPWSRVASTACHSGQEHHAGADRDWGCDSEPGPGRVSGGRPWPVQGFGAWLGLQTSLNKPEGARLGGRRWAVTAAPHPLPARLAAQASHPQAVMEGGILFWGMLLNTKTCSSTRVLLYGRHPVPMHDLWLMMNLPFPLVTGPPD